MATTATWTGPDTAPVNDRVSSNASEPSASVVDAKANGAQVGLTGPPLQNVPASWVPFQANSSESPAPLT